MWFKNSSYMNLCYLVLLSILIQNCESDWVEIPQFETKKIPFPGATPYTPYIYEQSLFPSTTIPSYDTVIEPDSYKHYVEEKKSITKLPDSFIRNKAFTTEPTVFPIKSKKPKNQTTPIKHKQNNKDNKKPHAKNNAKNMTTTTTTTTTQKPQSKILDKKYSVLDEDENEFEDVAAYEDDEYEDERDMDSRNDALGDDEYYDDTEYEDDLGEDEDDLGEYEDEPVEKETNNGYSYVGFLPYLKKIQSTLIRNSHTNTNSKVSFLANIRDRLLFTIKQKIANLWSFNKPSFPASRHTRSTRERGDDHHPSWENEEKGMDFPSNEGALLTLGFLTFAVFLIKCVLKLIHAFKGKEKGGNKMQMHMMYYPYTTTTTTTTVAGRRKRDVEEEDLRILGLIDTYKHQ